ncbi:MAG TPA: xanthine dehydrogenase, partial [Clostridia bacterium]
DCHVIVASENKFKWILIHEVFIDRLMLPKCEFIVQFIIGKEYTSLPFIHVKKTKNEKIDYPLISIAALKKDSRIRLAMSGVCSFPFRASLELEEYLNDRSISREARVENTVNNLPAPVLNDISGSDSYRRFVLKNTLCSVLESLEGIK